MRYTIRLLLVWIALGSVGFAEEASQLPTPVKAELILEETAIQPGRPFWVGVYFSVDEGWHSYWRNPGDSGMPLTIDWSLPEGFTVSDIEWPHPRKFTVNDMVGFGYEGSVMLLAKIEPPQTFSSDEPIELKANASWVACSDETCLPGRQTLTLQAPVTKETPAVNEALKTYFETARKRLPLPLPEVVAAVTDHQVELNFQMPFSLDPDAHVQFFSADADGGLDMRKDPVVYRTDSDGCHKLALQQAQDAKPTRINGVLVVGHEDQTIAYAVDIPLVGAYEELVGWVYDAPELQTGGMHDEVGSVGFALILAFAGGLLLNLMPCVLPVISFKVLGFVKMAGSSRWHVFLHGLLFTAGVLLSFWLLAGLLLILQAYGQSVGWGFQLQEPLFVAYLAAFIFIFSLSLFGVFEVGTSLMNMAGDAELASKKDRHELMGSFFSGILATAVATPCTGPFLGSAVGFAVTLPAYQAMFIFTSLALGMSAPYLLLAGFPGLLRFMPRPGAWMETFKQLMGFMMLATVIWLAWVFGAQTGSNGLTLLIIALFIVSVGTWVYGKWCTPINSKIAKSVAVAMLVASLLAGNYAIMQAAKTEDAHSSEMALADSDWEPFSPERVEALKAEGTPVLIDFTAKWCLICQANHMVFESPDVSRELKAKGVVKMKADWTRYDPVITEELKKYGRNSVPLYVLFDGKENQPQLLPQVLTSDAVLDPLRNVEQASK